jgi:long-chain acyl-CoA synthetase
MFCYTSGTTGNPKGAKMSHAAFVAMLHLHDHVKFNFTTEDVSISFLPYAHSFEQCLFLIALAYGMAFGYYSGNPLTLLDDVQTL